jgi:acetyl-CoA synthetase
MLRQPLLRLIYCVQAMYNRSLQDSDGFWAEQARSLLSWFRDFDHVQQGSFSVGDIAWFTGGKVLLSLIKVYSTQCFMMAA